MTRTKTVLIATALTSVSASASAQKDGARPELLTKLIACQQIGDVPERVACYDRQVAALDQAERKREVALVDRTEVRKARRSLFGFNMPDLRIFERGEDEPEFTSIDASIQNVSRQGGRLSMQLDDGTRWIQSDSEELARSPKAGMRVRIRKAAMGSYFANIEKAPAIRVRRTD
jgi:hypothetical protein